MKHSGETGESKCLTVKQARKIYTKNRKRIKQLFMQKKVIYKSLDVDKAYEAFIKPFQKDDFSVLQAFPSNATNEEIECHLETLIRHYLIVQTFYALEESFVKERLKNKLRIYDPNDAKLSDVIDFVTEHIERNNFARIKSFEEKCTFKTFMATVVTSILNDCWRSIRSAQQNVKRYVGTKFQDEVEETEENGGTIKQEIAFADLFQNRPQDPYEVAVQDEYMEFLPEVLKELEKERLLVLKMKYTKGMNVTQIARTLGKSRYKTEQFISQTEFLVKKEIMLKLEKRRRQQ
jgi:RNA polymerase sigma factor (sigma-70 family)